MKREEFPTDAIEAWAVHYRKILNKKPLAEFLGIKIHYIMHLDWSSKEVASIC